MLKVDHEWLLRVERRYPRIRRSIDYYEALDLPPCPACGSGDTAAVTAGIVGYSVHLAAATTKIKLLPHGVPEDYYCNACELFFGGPGPDDDVEDLGGSLLLDPRTATGDDLEGFVRALKAQAKKAERVERRSRERGASGE